MKIALTDNKISSVLYNMLRHADIHFDIKDGHICFFSDSDYQKALKFQEQEKGILEDIEKRMKEERKKEEQDNVKMPIEEKKKPANTKKRSLF